MNIDQYKFCPLNLDYSIIEKFIEFQMQTENLKNNDSVIKDQQNDMKRTFNKFCQENLTNSKNQFVIVKIIERNKNMNCFRSVDDCIMFVVDPMEQ
ncbi:MAG: hypothetical protein GY823_07290 [Flavobacteriaceae bacterium]|nr:hypothetical protein [Flavobacteriaceae bacterium]